MRVGLDLGGTKLEVIVTEVTLPEGRLDVRLRKRCPTPQADGYEAVVDRATTLVRDACTEAGVDIDTVPIGVGMPGGVERRTGYVKNSNTLCLNGRPFRSDFQRSLGRAVAFDNDANCFALAEATLGAARAHRAGLVFGVILGTGVGGGLVIGGEVWHGAQGIGGEWGHHGVFAGKADARQCYCGRRGCLEVYASGPALEKHYRELSGRPRSATEIADLAENNDAAAVVALELFLSAFGRGLANVINICDPTAIVLGGGLSKLACLYTRGRERVSNYVFNDELTTPILPPALGDSAGVFGAALIGLSKPSGNMGSGHASN